MRALKQTNWGNSETIAVDKNGPNGTTIAKVSIDQLPEEERRRSAFDPMQWTLVIRTDDIKYPGVDRAPIYVACQVLFGHGGNSVTRDVEATAIGRSTGAGSTVEVRARFVDKNGVLVPASSATYKGTTCVVNAVIAPGTDAEAEPQLEFFPRVKSTANAALLLHAKQTRLRRIIVNTQADAVTYLQLFDKQVAPVNTDVPVALIVIPATRVDQFDRDFGHQGRSFSSNCWAALSTTEDTLTIDAAHAFGIETQIYRTESV